LTPADQKKLVSTIEQATGIFFAGGDQNILMTFIKEYRIKELLQKRFAQGVMFGGTSAGTAIMSNPMLTGKADLGVIDGSRVELAEGLGLLPPGVIVDQHFIVRQRFNRMAGLMISRKGSYGIAVDENSSLLILGREAKVIGPTQVLIFKPIDRNRLEISVMESNKIFNL
jgi:cyanophycinase